MELLPTVRAVEETQSGPSQSSLKRAALPRVKFWGSKILHNGTQTQSVRGARMETVYICCLLLVLAYSGGMITLGSRNSFPCDIRNATLGHLAFPTAKYRRHSHSRDKQQPRTLKMDLAFHFSEKSPYSL